jgi:flagellar hook-associated protein 2
MSTIQLPGLFTGIDTKQLIAQLMAVEQRTLNAYEERKSLWEERKEALSTLQTKLTTLKSSVKALSDSQELRAFQVASSDSDVLTAEASYSAFEGNHKVVINQLATAERWIHTSGLEYAEDYVGAGTFIYSYNNEETIITTTATTTLEDLVGLINNDANNPGVTAGLLYHNSTYHLVLNGNGAGSDYRISINTSNTETWQTKSTFTVNGSNATLSSKITNLDQFSGTLASGEKITISGEDHNGNAISGELNITSNTKLTHLISEINDAFDGRAVATLVNGEIHLMDGTCGTSQMELYLSYDPGSGSTTLTLPDEADDWNISQGGETTANLTDFAVSDFTKTQSAQDSKIKVNDYPSTSAVAEVQHLSFTDKATAGTFTLTYDGQTTAAINYDATLVEIQAALEALPNVSSDDITVGGDRLNNNDGTMTFTFRDTLGDVSLISINPSNLTPSDNSNYVMTEYTQGNDGWISRSSNTVDDVIHGVTLHLHDITDSSGEQLTLTRDIESLKTKLNTMVDAYNAAVTHIQEKTGYNEVLKTAGVLMGDYIVSNIKSQLYTPLISQTTGFVEDIDSFLTPGHIGLELDKDGVLSLDTNVLDEAIAEDYMDVLSIIGSDKDGSSDSNTIEFYGASSDYTTAGTYDVEVTVISGVIDSAKIKLSTESTYRDATYSGNIVTGDSSFDENGDPVYPENGLQLSVDLSQDNTFTATVRVKQGFAGAIEDALDRMLKLTTGSIQIDQEYVDDTIEDLQEKIELEEERLARKEEQLVKRFARLESTLALLQSQMAALGFE